MDAPTAKRMTADVKDYVVLARRSAAKSGILVLGRAGMGDLADYRHLRFRPDGATVELEVRL